MTKLMAVAIPILPGKTEQWKKFSNELNTRYKKEFNASRKELGVQERTFLQKGPNGDLVIVTLQGENPQDAFTKFAAKKDEFATWFNSQVTDIHGIDFTKPMNMPFPELIAESEPISEPVLK